MNDQAFVKPEITDADVSWISAVLGLPERAFFGKDGNDPRRDILVSMDPADVAACPGSGKTTLLVANLAILARKWQYRTRGLCVLSHTNTARREIETHLGNSTIGRQLLSYPHFVGTIHSFVNEFLAVPWLHAKGYRPKVIDTEACFNRRWNALPVRVRSMLERNRHTPSSLVITSVDFDIGPLRWGKGVLGQSTQLYQQLRSACERSALDGYFCYDDMFLWAWDLISKVPGAVEAVRERFPLVFVDEAQDTTEGQSALLYRIFVEGRSTVTRKRFGDENQAIFELTSTSEATTDRFPIGPIRRELPLSHRFGQRIADLADPLGLEPYGMVGLGPRKPHAPHTVFLFSDDSVPKVLDQYGELLAQTFSEEELRHGTFTAVGHVHRSDRDPRRLVVGDYWRDYNPELTPQDPKPRTFVDYVLAGVGKATKAGEAYGAVEKIAEGILRLASLADGNTIRRQRGHSHRYVQQLLEGSGTVKGLYEELVLKLALGAEVLSRSNWNERWRDVVRRVAEKIAGVALQGHDVDRFLGWTERGEDPGTGSSSRDNRDNVYQYANSSNSKVQIRVASIHSVKGESHTATLVLETFWYSPNLDALRPWLLGERKGWSKSDGERQKSRLKLHYVAMTRPTHLLCLALNRTTFEDGNGRLIPAAIQELQYRGWQVKVI